MNITEANAVVTVLRLLDGSNQREDPAEITNAIEHLVTRVEKPLRLQVRLDTERIRQNVLDLHRHSVAGGQVATTTPEASR